MPARLTSSLTHPPCRWRAAANNLIRLGRDIDTRPRHTLEEVRGGNLSTSRARATTPGTVLSPAAPVLEDEKLLRAVQGERAVTILQHQQLWGLL